MENTNQLCTAKRSITSSSDRRARHVRLARSEIRDSRFRTRRTLNPPQSYPPCCSRSPYIAHIGRPLLILLPSLLLPSSPGGWQSESRPRASNEHILIVRPLRARRMVWRLPPHSFPDHVEPHHCNHMPQPASRRCGVLSLQDILRVHRSCRLIHPLDSFRKLQKILWAPTALSWLAMCSYYMIRWHHS